MICEKSSTKSQFDWMGNSWMSSNAKRKCVEYGSSVELSRKVIKRFPESSQVKVGKFTQMARDTKVCKNPIVLKEI